MTPELLEAMEVVREGFSRRNPRYHTACELLAREFIRMADAGELVRVKTCYECLDDGCLLCDGSGRIYESLTAKGDA